MIYWTNAGEHLAAHEWLKVKRRGSKRRPGGIWLDNIFAIDTETTSAFLTPSGDIIPFDFEKPEAFWSKCKKFGWVYIWMFGVDDMVFYGRTFAELRSFLELLDDLTGEAEKIVYCHNLAFDWQFLRDALHFEKVFARTKRKVLTADAGHLHFRCSYFLVNMSLAKWAKSARLSVRKLEGDLDYLKIRTPIGKYSALTDQELAYCENDILVMLEGLKIFRDKYKNVFRIPLTQTGETRVALSEAMKDENKWRRLMGDLFPRTLVEYRYLMSAFFGGDVHGNYFLANKLLKGVRSFDFASSYPWVMLQARFPLSYFVRVTKNRERFMHNPGYCYLITFDAFRIESKMHNTFLSKSRCQMTLNAVVDNGRVVKADFVQCTMTNVDYEMFREYYAVGDLRIVEFKVAVAGYLDPELCRFILECYVDKTKYKGLDEYYSLYMFKKQIANGIYGDMVTRIFADDTTWDPEEDWGLEQITEDKYQEKLQIIKRNTPKLYKTPQLGVWVTAYARRNLWRYLIAPLDHQVAYFDTDCVKFIGADRRGAISSYNMWVIREHAKIAERIGVDVSMLSPCDPSGKAHPIGCAESETGPLGMDFKTLGAKKYACQEHVAIMGPPGPVEITVAGVPKGCAALLKSPDDLSDDFYFPPSKEPGQKKSILHYMDEQDALDVGGWIMDNPHGICLQPTGYKVGLTAEYMALILANAELYQHEIFTEDIEGQ